MKMRSLIVHKKPELKNPRMVLGFSGWMNGGEASTGTVEYLIEKVKGEKFAEIEPEEFYIFNFPGSMDTASLFRPSTKIKNGLLKDIQFPKNEFFYGRKSNILLFKGKEPNFLWRKYSNCIFEIVSIFKVKEIYFVGSVAGSIPHTREPRIWCSFSHEKLRSKLKKYDIKFSDYEGPSSITTLLMKFSKEKRINMISFVAEVPIYVQGKNPKAIESLVSRLIKLLGLDIDLSDLHEISEKFEKKLDEIVSSKPELVEQIKKLEDIYDKELVEEMGDMEEWLKKQGVKLD